MSAEPNYVEVAAYDDVKIRVPTPTDDVARLIERWQFERLEDDRYNRAVGSDEEKARLFDELRAAGFYFLLAREWSPSEVFEELRERGLIEGPFTDVYRTGPGEWQTRPNPFVLPGGLIMP